MPRDSSPSRGRFPRAPWIARGALALVLLGGGAVAFVKHQDEDNRFCIACHLHREQYDAMVSAPPTTLAAAHHRARGAGHPERCFTCHSGEGLGGWSAVTLLSAWDAARWVAGDRHEPRSMRLPVSNQACLKCHDSDLRAQKRDEQKFHGIPDHRHKTLPCVSCHRTHDRGRRERRFLDDVNVRSQCQRCHRDLEES